MITYSELRELVSYNPNTGLFIRIKTQCNSAKKGSEPGHVKRCSGGLKYRALEYKGKPYYLHRLAHLYMTGEWPQGDIDHEDGDGLNNKWDNIRTATMTENQKNRRLNANSKSGVTGVSFYSRNKKWRVAINIRGKKKHLGYFETFEEAVEIRMKANKENDYHDNHGQQRRM